jgi:hypothetical protein
MGTPALLRREGLFSRAEDDSLEGDEVRALCCGWVFLRLFWSWLSGSLALCVPLLCWGSHALGPRPYQVYLIGVIDTLERYSWKKK